MLKRDIKMIETPDGTFDITFTDGDITADEGFETAIMASLFTDARASESQVGSPEQRRGWLGNTLSTVPGREVGGLMYLAEQRRLTQDTVNENVDFAQKSLAWMTEDRLAQRIDVSGELIPKKGVRLTIAITTPNDKLFFSVDLWENTIQ